MLRCTNCLIIFTFRERILLLNEPYKLELLDSIKSEPITIYHIGKKDHESVADVIPSNDSDIRNKDVRSWWDLCAGPHMESTGQLNIHAIELQSIAGAYWRGDEKRPMLQVCSKHCLVH